MKCTPVEETAAPPCLISTWHSTMSDLVERLRAVQHFVHCAVYMEDTPKCDCMVLVTHEAADRIEELENRPADRTSSRHVPCDPVAAADCLYCSEKATSSCSVPGHGYDCQGHGQWTEAYSAVPPCDCGADLGHDHDRCSYQRYVDAREAKP